ncbi:MAG: hypothetical protein UU48_C0006G0073 [Candidatus Uhrbacteria bacterium GW2011_GWF2_41_16]|uniref:DUF4178 domain-containing protein n=2 Tax=Candidatus Uhriibacteriota TaxID=1752732 RepID=A0A0G0VAM4_9BACT|nr:MAG: hypothetical protein UU35_C0007G0060 [Candidatus Uhrbacteria bacterium GW2011_GWC2_41_11]KKR98033.1 MAG: hypothetical protein UU48_C0006G0073 [Candidatus Uhrbacteria bacterium GW2011_GWF2_41_16]HBO99696.1 hypothetical protein [Candidatus Uhrbacteria bacterium]
MMTLKQLLETTQPGQTLLAHNDPFDYQGKAEITLEGGDVIYWLFNEKDSFISVNPETDEMVDFRGVEDEVEREEDDPGTVGYEGDNYELSYEDRGTLTKIEGDIPLEEGHIFVFKDYEKEDGGLVRILENEMTGEEQIYAGSILVEEEVTLVED